MKKVLLGLAFVAAMILSLCVYAQDSKTKKVAPKTETAKTEASCCSVKASVPSCCGTKASAPACCAAKASVPACCSQQNTAAKADAKKDCSQADKLLAEKKTEAGKKK